MGRRRINQIVGLGLMVTVALAFITAVHAAEAQRTPDWRRALEKVWPETHVIEAVRARQPYAFETKMTHTAVHRGQFEYTAHLTADGAPGVLPIALPETPHHVYCALVQDDVQSRLLFVNYYTDNLWHADWVVLDGGQLPVAADTQEHLNAIGCRLTSQD